MGMRILIAMDEDVLARNEEPAAALAPIAAEHEVVIAYAGCARLGPELDLGLRNALPDRDVVSLLTRVVVDEERPQAIAQVRSVRVLLDAGAVVVCAGSANLPVVLDEHGAMRETQAPVDYELTSALLARRLDADLLLMLGEYHPPSPPRMNAASLFAETTGRRAVLGALEDVAEMVSGEAGMEVVAPPV